jgi:hypothetical protein
MPKPKTSPSSGTDGAMPEQPNYRSNPEVDAKIDAYIKDNPKYYTYIQALPRERLERTVILNEVRELDRQQRIRGGLMKNINANPDLKRAYETLVKELPETERENVIAQLAQQAKRAVSRSQNQQQSKKEAVGV